MAEFRIQVPVPVLARVVAPAPLLVMTGEKVLAAALLPPRVKVRAVSVPLRARLPVLVKFTAAEPEALSVPPVVPSVKSRLELAVAPV